MAILLQQKLEEYIHGLTCVGKINFGYIKNQKTEKILGGTKNE
jgi:hypothetical protein